MFDMTTPSRRPATCRCVPRSRTATRYALAGLVLPAGCGVSRPWSMVPRPAQSTPDRFIAPDSGRTTAPTCFVILADPRDDTRLELVRSTEVVGRSPRYMGDYAVTPAGRYGVDSRELLRVDCEARRAIGVVDRS